MQLGVKDTAALLNVSEKTIYRWIKQNRIPAYRINDQYRFNRMELLEWANAARMPVSPQIFAEDANAAEDELPSMNSALQDGGIFYRIEGSDKQGVLKNVIEHMRLPDDVDRDFLFQAMLAREELGSTSLGDGIAIPHVRNPLILHISRPCLTLCFLEKPVAFGALDGKPVHTIFALVTPTVRSHLHLLSRLAFSLKDPDFINIIKNQGSREEILSAISDIEKSLQSPQ